MGVVLPYFHTLDEEANVEHFTRVAAAFPDFPVFICNIPQCTVNNFTPSILAKILERVDNFAGMKTSNPDFFQLQEYVAFPSKPEEKNPPASMNASGGYSHCHWIVLAGSAD